MGAENAQDNQVKKNYSSGLNNMLIVHSNKVTYDIYRFSQAKSEAPVNSNLSFKSNNKLAIVFYKSVNFRAHSCDF